MREIGFPHEALVDGDAHCHSVAAAGIIAKTVRDRLMRRLAARHAGYGWERNSGYGSAEHFAAIRTLRPDRSPPPELQPGERTRPPYLAFQNALSWFANSSGT